MKLLVQVTAITSMLGSAIASMEVQAKGQQNGNIHYIYNRQQNSYPSGGDQGKPITGNQINCNEMLVEVNEFRKQNSKGPLKLDAKLIKAAQLHSDDQAKSKKMSHTGSNGSSMSDRINAQNYKWSGLAENVAWNQKTIKKVMHSWINSPGHRKNLLGDYVDFGCGLNDFYWVQNFGTPSNYNTQPEKNPSKPVGYPVNRPNKPVEKPQPEQKPTQPEQKPTQPEYKPTQPEQKPVTGPTDKPLSANDKLDCGQMLVKVNEFRKQNNKQPLQINDKLVKASQLHSDDQANSKKMSHTGSNGSSMSDRIDAQNYKWSGLAENVAWNQKSIEQVMNSWINSPGHRKNLLGNYVDFGCGFNNFYWVQNFASPMGKY